MMWTCVGVSVITEHREQQPRIKEITRRQMKTILTTVSLTKIEMHKEITKRMKEIAKIVYFRGLDILYCKIE